MTDAIDFSKVKGRLAVLQLACKFPTQKEFAQTAGASVTTMSNWLTTGRIPRDAAARMCMRISGLSLDWIYLGRVDGLSVAMLSKIRIAEKRITATQ